MYQRIIQLLFLLLRSSINGDLLTSEERELYDRKMLPEIIKIAKKHDIAQILAYGLEKNGFLTKEDKKISNEMPKALYRYQGLNYEFGKLCASLEKAQISFIPLKGNVIRKYYPQPWMRTSCDIDILVKENELEKTISFLQKECHYQFKEESAHDVSLISPNGKHIELHYQLIEKGKVQKAAEILKNVWITSKVSEGCRHCYEMTDEMFYFYHIAHMAKHFEIGGCGIRSFIDLWILDQIKGIDSQKRDKLLKEGNLLEFAEKLRKLNRIWFEGEMYDELSRKFELYILTGGIYGSSANRILVQQQRKGGCLQYAFSKIFLPYDIIKFHYPVLQKYRWLTPMMEVCRWGKLIFGGHLKRTIKELTYNSRISKEDAERTKKFLKELGL